MATLSTCIRRRPGELVSPPRVSMRAYGFEPITHLIERFAHASLEDNEQLVLVLEVNRVDMAFRLVKEPDGSIWPSVINQKGKPLMTCNEVTHYLRNKGEVSPFIARRIAEHLVPYEACSRNTLESLELPAGSSLDGQAIMAVVRR